MALNFHDIFVQKFSSITITDNGYITSASPTSLNGTGPSLVMQAPGGATLIRFDLNQLINAGVTPDMISKAYVKLYLTAVTAQGKFDVYAVTSNWSEKTVTYNTRPTIAGSPAVAGIMVTNAGSYVIIDITALLKSWLTVGGLANFGIELVP